MIIVLIITGTMIGVIYGNAKLMQDLFIRALKRGSYHGYILSDLK